MKTNKVQLIECPRDAMQGIRQFISTERKLNYLNQLLKVGYHTLDFGSFVSPSAIPQMKDTAKVIEGLKLEYTNTKLLAIVANLRGAKEACQFDRIHYLGFPLSMSEIFQQRNTNTSIAHGVKLIDQIMALCQKNNKELIVYLSMAFGNPYGEGWNVERVIEQSWELKRKGICVISISDTVGVSTKQSINNLFCLLINEVSEVNFGAHLHSKPKDWREKIEAAYLAGCRRFDCAIYGFGGCPMADDELVGNMPTEKAVSYLNQVSSRINLDKKEFKKAQALATSLFRDFH